MEKILKSFLKKLTNINSSNKSICLLKLYSGQFFDLNRLDYLYKKPSHTIIEHLISGKKNFPLCSELDSRDETVNEISRSLKRISRKDKSLFEEVGTKDLYIGWPFIKGKLSDGTLIRCPLLYFPISLALENGEWLLKQRSDHEIILNKPFLLAYAHFNAVSLSDEFVDTPVDFDTSDTLTFKTQLYEFLKNSPLEINFNQDLFSNTLVSFKEYTASDYEANQKKGELKLYSEAILGIFPQAGSYLVPDYENLIKENTLPSLEDFFSSKHHIPDFFTKKESQNFTIFPIDASQEEALWKIKAGNSIVVQGPPGTGKSQLICNLISDFTARGKKVAVVCRKKAALDVVYARLKEKNIHDFSGLVHDFKNDRGKLFDQLRFQIENIDRYKKENIGLDTIHLERSHTHASAQIQQHKEILDDFKNALFDTSEYGISAKELYLTSNPNHVSLPLKEVASRFNLETSLNFERKIKNHFPYAILFSDDNYIWKDRNTFHDYYQRDIQSIEETILKIHEYQKNLVESAQRSFNNSADYPFDFFLSNTPSVQKIFELIKEEDDYFLLLKFTRENTTANWLEDRQKRFGAIVKNSQPERTLPLHELDNCETTIHRYLDSRGNFLSSLYWSIFSGEREYLKEVLSKNKLKLTPDGALALSKKIITRKKLEKERSTIQKQNLYAPFPENLSQESISNWFELNYRILEAKNIILDQSPELNSILIQSNNDYKTFCDYFHLIPLLALDIEKNLSEWKSFLSASMISDILYKKKVASTLIDTLKKDFDKLVEFDKLRKELLSFETELLDALHHHTNAQTVEEKIYLFRNSIRLQWLEEIEKSKPILLAASSLKLEQSERGLLDAIEDKTKTSTEIVQLRLKEGSYKNVEYNRLQNRVTYRDLFHQVTKKKKLWPLRKVIKEHKAEILDLIPCWLLSPESFSALFPLENIFDLVIFDEASQCFSEHGLPAMQRGKQLVIAGDSKQLKPNDLYQARWEDENEDMPDLEIDSLLDLSEKYLSSIQLSSHYRSKNLALIDFSNKEFYNQSLELIPYFSDMNSTEPSILYTNVEGQWKNNTNTIEAEKIVDTCFKIFETSPKKSIGVVTFNFKQAQLILDLLEKEAIHKNRLLPKDLFVKNIENVQGDEKDIILFSVGYAPDSLGRFNMQFGSLNQDGGENRLNVAITRAKEKIYLFTSFLPQQLSVENSLHNGPKLLKKYLEYAYEVSNKSYKPSIKPKENTRQEWYLSHKIISKPTVGSPFDFVEELPFSDITIKKSNGYHGLILTDDQLYFQSQNCKEYHAYKIKEWNEKGWKWKRVYSRQYWLEQGDFIRNTMNMNSSL